jgi:hypothetical protein
LCNIIRARVVAQTEQRDPQGDLGSDHEDPESNSTPGRGI